MEVGRTVTGRLGELDRVASEVNIYCRKTGTGARCDRGTGEKILRKAGVTAQ
jgi:hypothetical protein